LDQATQHKPIGARLWIAMSFGAALFGASMLGGPTSYAANEAVPVNWATLEAAAQWGQERVTAVERIVARPEVTELSRSTPEGVQLASLGGQEAGSSGKEPRSSLSGGTVRWSASSFCLDGRLREVINQVAAIFGPVKVNSTCRSRARNAKVGGATRSKHLTGDAADFSVSKNKPAVLTYLQRNSSVGGLKLYPGGHFHIDTGPRRTW
jgi:hypothetical protein